MLERFGDAQIVARSTLQIVALQIDTPRGKTTDRGPSPDGYPEPEPVIVVANDHKVVTASRKNR